MKKLITAAVLVALAATPALAKMKDHSQNAEMWFNKMDTNGDGSISQDEHIAFTTKMWNMADADGDGKVTREEFKAAKMKQKDAWKGSQWKNPNDSAGTATKSSGSGKM